MGNEHIEKILSIMHEGLSNGIERLDKYLLILIVLTIIVILNQRKIRKELRQLREMMENQDKPE